ncbi:bacterial transcriptional activator domain-containing protein [Streptomyces sp. NPDC002784]
MSATAIPAHRQPTQRRPTRCRSARRRPARSRRATAALLLGIGLLLTLPPHATAQPSPTATSTAGTGGTGGTDGTRVQPPVTLDSDDPVLALAEGATLAAPKILELKLTRLSIHHLIEPQQPGGPGDKTASPRASASAPAGRQPGRQPGGTASTTGPTASASLLPAPPSGKAHPSTPASSQPPTAAPTSDVAPTSDAVPAGGEAVLRTVLGAGMLLAALVTALLALRLHLRRSRTAHAHRARLTSALPAQAAGQAGTARSDLTRLHTALRTLAHHPGSTYAVQAALVTTTSVHVLPHDHAAAPPEPFAKRTGRWWALPDDAVLLDGDGDGDGSATPAPCPGLVTLGTTTDGSLFLLNLAAHSALLLDGSPDHLIEVCASLTLEALTSPWAGGLDVWIVGFADDLPHALPHPSHTHLPHAGEALRALSERLLEIHQQPPGHPIRPLLLLAPTLTPTTAQQIADLLATSDQAAVTLIAPRSSAEASWPEAELLDATLSGPQRLHCTGTDITLQRLPHADYRQIIHTLHDTPGPEAHAERAPRTGPGMPDTANNTPRATPSGRLDDNGPQSGLVRDDDAVFPALLPSGPAQARRAAPSAAQPAAGHDGSPAPTPAHDAHAPELRVLGPVEMDHVPTTGHGPRQAQLAALLYFRPGRNADTLCTHMDPTHPWTRRTLNARLQGLRHALGNDPDGNPYVPRRQHADDPYHLSPTIRCDWTHFTTLTDHALTPGIVAGDSDSDSAGGDGDGDGGDGDGDGGGVRLHDLEHALTLVRGRPFGPRPLPWQEPLQQEMTTRIIAVAHTIATHRTAAGPHYDLSAARQAVATGLDVDHAAELLYRDWLRIEHTAGNRQGLHTAITRVQQVNRSLDCSLETETEALIHHLLNSSNPA